MHFLVSILWYIFFCVKDITSLDSYQEQLNLNNYVQNTLKEFFLAKTNFGELKKVIEYIAVKSSFY